jgi:uncharacterized membrane protein
MMEDLFKELTEHVALFIEAVGVLVIAIGTIDAVASTYRVMIRSATPALMRDAWLRYARWLVAGLTFQLAGDIVHTAIAPSWEDVGKLAAIAVIRTFLTYFLDHDMEGMRALKFAQAERKAGVPPT